MFWDFIAMIAAGAGLAGIIMLLRKMSRGKIPSWAIPAAIGLGMLSFSIWNEYTWYPRAVSALPAQVAVISAPPTKQMWRPWTYVFPMHQRFLAYDGINAKTSLENAAIRRGDIMVVQRWQQTRRVPIAVDCAKGLRAYLIEGGDIAPDGTLTGASWNVPDGDDLTLQAACKEE